ncbi:MAG: SPOR domain-containing protein [Treponema sp.]
MKNKIEIICAVIISCLMLASFSPSLDGRAVVADEGTFPEGLFAKTVGYLPGDSITVSNLSTKKTIDILVVGALDPSEGVAILLSPEAAFALGIEKNSNSIVKITKRSGQLDEAVSGTAVIANGTAAEAEPAGTPADGSTDTVAVPANTAADNTAEVADASKNQTEAQTASSGTTTAQPETAASERSSVEAISATETPVQPEPAGPETEVVTPDDKTAEKAATAAGEKINKEVPSSEETAVPPVEELETTGNATTASAGDIVNENAPAEKESDVTSAGESGNIDNRTPVATEEKVNERIPAACEPAETPVSESVGTDKKTADETGSAVDENVPVPEETPEAEKTSDISACEDEVSPEPYDEKPSESVPVPAEKVDEQPAAEEKPAAAEPVPDESVTGSTPSPVENKTASDAYAPIILVPAEPNPPESDKGKPESEAKSGPSIPEKPAGETAPVPTSSEGEFDRYTVPNLKALSSGKYYIQIGVYADEGNIREVVRKYSGTYPITIVPLVSGKAQQLMIGPLSVDEYAAVIERFKSYGYKDAFLRKIK